MSAVLAAVRHRAAVRSHPDLPVLDGRVVLTGALSSAGLYLLLVAWALPGTVDIVAAMPVGVRLGVLLLASTVTRFAAGWLAARRYRVRHGLPVRSVAVPSAALGGFCGFLLVALLAGLGGGEASVGEVLLDAVRWPLECAVGALLAMPGAAGGEPARPYQPPTGRTRS